MWTYNSVSGIVTVCLVCADMPALLLAINSVGISLYDIKQSDPLTFHVVVKRKDYKRLRGCAERCSASIKIVAFSGGYWAIKKLLKRPVLLLGCFIVLFLSMWLPTRILFVEVEGNNTVPSNKIIEKAQQCGIVFGASRRNVRSEKMKNSLLAAIPELQWAGINTIGCRAVISVTERSTDSERHIPYSVCSIVAVRDGIVESCTATRGTALCKEGQAVKQGEVLISGYSDCGIAIQATRAEGEVYAQTNHSISVVVPTNYQMKETDGGQITKISVIFGKKRINLFKDSGIYSTTCVKMYKEYPMSLPGGFLLPVTLAVEQWSTSTALVMTADAEFAQSTASLFAQDYLRKQMLSGQILDSTETVEQMDEVLVFRGSYLCREMIGRVQYEGTMDIYGKTD